MCPVARRPILSGDRPPGAHPVPYPDGAVRAARGELITAGAERDGQDAVGLTVQLITYFGGLVGVPQPDGFVAAARREHPTVRAEPHTVHSPTSRVRKTAAW